METPNLPDIRALRLARNKSAQRRRATPALPGRAPRNIWLHEERQLQIRTTNRIEDTFLHLPKVGRSPALEQIAENALGSAPTCGGTASL